MGAEFNYYTFEGPESRLEAHHRRIQRQLCEQYGNDTYAGHIGIMPEGIDKGAQPRATKQEAIEALETHHNKWQRAMAIPFLRPGAKRKLNFVVGGWCAS